MLSRMVHLNLWGERLWKSVLAATTLRSLKVLSVKSKSPSNFALQDNIYPNFLFLAASRHLTQWKKSGSLSRFTKPQVLPPMPLRRENTRRAWILRWQTHSLPRLLVSVPAVTSRQMISKIQDQDRTLRVCVSLEYLQIWTSHVRSIWPKFIRPRSTSYSQRQGRYPPPGHSE